MSDFDLSAEESSRAWFAPASSEADVKLTRPDRQVYMPPTISEAPGAERSKRATVLVVLTLICTALVIFDLCLLAWRS
jgi:hypothetical protein